MSQSIEEFDFSQLSPAQRIVLAQDLWDSVHQTAPLLTEAQKAELDRRLADLESGTVKGVPWEEVKQSLLDES